jgi:hypothetical protein
MEPVGACGRTESELWLEDPALEVITSTVFGGFGRIYADVYVEIGAKVAAGFASLGVKGACYEQIAGTLYTKDLRLDSGSELHFTVGTPNAANSIYPGQAVDVLDVDNIITRGDVKVFIEKRPCQEYDTLCYPILRYKSAEPGALNRLHLATPKLDDYALALDIDSIEQVVYLCIGGIKPPVLERAVVMPSVAGVTSNPPATGVHYTTNGDFKFTLTFADGKPLKVKTSRIINGVQEVLTGTLNANGEYEYILRQVKTQPIYIYIGPEEQGSETVNEAVNGAKVWASGNTLYINVAAEDVASIYSVVGKLVRRIDISEGQTGVPMESGVYVVTLKDGSVHKVIIQ